MSVERTGNNSNSASQQAPNNVNEAAFDTHESILFSDALMPRGFDINGTSENLKVYFDAVDKAIDEKRRVIYRLLDLDVASSLSCSALILTRRLQNKADGQAHVFFHIMPVETTSRIPSEVTQQLGGGRSVPVIQTLADALDPKMFAMARDRVKEAFPGAVLHNAGASNIYNSIDPTKPNDVKSILVAAGRALDGTVATTFGTEKVFNVGWIDKTTDRVFSKISYNPEQAFDRSGLPMRNDFSVTVTTRSVKNEQSSIHTDNLEYSRVHGYVDIIFRPPPQAQFQGQVTPPQRYVPRIILTMIESLISASTLETRLFSIVTAATLMGKSMNYAGVWLPRSGINPKEDTRDIGAIGYEVPVDPTNPNVPLGNKVDVRSNKFGREDLGLLIRTGFYDMPVFSYDAVVLGPDHWLDEVFINASKGDDAAIKRLVKAANNLTLGKFDKHFKGGILINNDMNTVAVGTYKDDSGIRDIRDLDYLALLNLTGAKGLQSVIDWDGSFDPSKGAEKEREDVRNQFIHQRFQGREQIKAKAVRLTFGRDFIQALILASHEAGLDVRPENAALDLTNRGNRGYYDTSLYGIDPNATTGLFSYAPAPVQQGSNYGGFSSTWQ